jgi:hypothetical protein
MSTRLTDHDYELLSAYLDGALSDSERSTLEARLQAEPDLRRELETLRQTVMLVKGLPTLKAPRNFILDAHQSRQQRLLIFPTTAMFSALSAAAAVFLLVLGATFLLVQNQLSAPAPLASVQNQQGGQSVAGLPSATINITNTSEADTGSQRAFTVSPMATPTQPPPAPALTFEATAVEAYDGADATDNIPLDQSAEPLGAAPLPTQLPDAANAAGEAEAPEEAQDSPMTDELQSQTGPAPEDTTSLAYAPTIQPPTNGLSDDSQMLEETATSLSAEFAAVQQEELTATPSPSTTPTLRPTAPPVANEVTERRESGDNVTFAGVLLVAGAALLLISIATTLVRWRRQ